MGRLAISPDRKGGRDENIHKSAIAVETGSQSVPTIRKRLILAVRHRYSAASM